jgi:lambda family phage tail tape measure protein
MAKIDRYKVQVDTAGAQKSVLGLKGALGALAGAFAAIKVGQALKEVVNITARFQDLRSSLTSVVGSIEGGAQAFQAIQDLSTKTQFGVEDLTKAYIKLGASGIKPTERLFKLFTDTAAITTDQIGSLEAITDLFSRTTSGGLGLEELNRLGDRGVPVFDILKEKIQKSRTEISEFGKTAEGAKLILNALAEGIEERFGGATAERLGNLSTQMSNFGIAVRNSADTMGQALAPAVGMVLNDLEKLITGNNDFARSLGEGIGRALVGTSATIQYMSGLIVDLGKRIADIVATPFRLLGDGLDWIARKFGYAGSATDDFADTVGEALNYTANEAKKWGLVQFVGSKLDEYDEKLAKATAATEKFAGGLDDIKIKGKDILSGATGSLKMEFKDVDKAVKEIEKSTEDLVFNLETANMSPLERQIQTIEKSLRSKLKTQLEALKKAMTPANADQINQQIKRITEATEQAIEKQVELTKQADAEQKKFTYGWEQAFRTYSEEATNAAKKAQRIFEITTQGMEDAIVNFARTGKFSFRDFINTVLEELLRSNIRELIASVFGPKKAGSGSSLLGSISNIFGGFFANGGFLPAGKLGIAGESGAELVSGPANISPVGGLGNITYNINAVDAMSFKQLLASEPEFLFAVSEQGRRSLPQTRR